MDLDHLDDLVNGDDASDGHVRCPECGGQGWEARYFANGDPPEQITCERCDGSGFVPEDTLSESERLHAEDQRAAMLFLLGEAPTTDEDEGILAPEEFDDPAGLIEDDDPFNSRHEGV